MDISLGKLERKTITRGNIIIKWQLGCSSHRETSLCSTAGGEHSVDSYGSNKENILTRLIGQTELSNTLHVIN